MSYRDYLDDLVRLCFPWVNRDSIVLEVGCGKGDFLKNLSDATGCRAVGYDSTYEGEEDYQGRVFFRRKRFAPQGDGTKYDLLILRHVLEHVAQPYDFMRNVCDPVSLKIGARLFIEVPDFDWILKKSLFFDITYEHCNYFFSETLSALAVCAGFEVEKVSQVFGGQYLLLSGIYTGETQEPEHSSSFPAVRELSPGFRETELELVEGIRKADQVCVWGASGKGVLFLSGLSEEVLNKISYVVDINPAKQGRFLPVSGKKVESPEALKQVEGKLLVVVMNEIYTQEIRAQIEGMDVQQFSITAL